MPSEEDEESDPGAASRCRRTLAAGARWVIDVFRGHARSRHLDNRED